MIMTTPLLFLVGTAAALLLIGAYLRKNRQNAVRLEVAEKALAGCHDLLELARAMQQHRGLSSGWLAGEQSFESRMQERRREIQRYLVSLTEVAEMETAMPKSCFTYHELTLFRFQWRELVEDLPSMSIEQSIARHSQMISRILDWLSALGEARVKLAMTDRITSGLVTNYIDRLPILAEYLGQLRAMGSGVAARQQCSPVARVRLRYLTSRAETLLKEAHTAFQDAKSDAAALAVGELLNTVRKELLDGAITLSADGYFQTATRAIDTVYSWVEECGNVIGEELGSDQPLHTAVLAS